MDNRRERRKEMCRTHILNNSQTSEEIAKTLMNEQRENIGNLSLL
jgi:hypothetical protein